MPHPNSFLSMVTTNDASDGRWGVFVLSPGERDEICQIARTVGWRPFGARRLKDAAQRYLRSDARIALVDVREGDHVDILGAMVPAVDAGAGALIVLVGEGQLSSVPNLLALGATHFITAPLTPEILKATLFSAERLIDRIGGGSQHSHRAQRIRRGDALYWTVQGGPNPLLLSDGLAQIFGIAGNEAGPADLMRHLPRKDRLSVIAALRAMMRTGRPTAFAHSLIGKPNDRMVHHLHINDGVVGGDVEPLNASRAGDGTGVDPLTGLRSRQAALEWMENRRGLATTVLLLSISQFDRMNSAYGQIVGDALLGRIARRIERLVMDLTGNTMVARIAGTDFLVGLTGDAAASERATFLARRLIAGVGQPFSAGDHLIRLTARCGIAQSRSDDGATELIRRASTALADARQAGGEGIRIQSADTRSRQVDPDRLETDLRLALDRGEIGIVFQPQYMIDQDRVIGQERITGVEALARWNHPHYGPLSAGMLFSTAERSDYMLPLSAHIQAEALRQAALWPIKLANLRLSINVTAADISQQDFMPNFLKLVDDSGFPRSRLTVEITESGLIDDLEMASNLLSAMREEGLAVAIDDFGTGYSSLAYLKNLPLDYLKIDSALAQDIAGSARDRIIVRGVIHMAKSLGLYVIAEGVETEQQLELLAREGCDFYQGFLRSAGVTSAELIRLVLKT